MRRPLTFVVYLSGVPVTAFSGRSQPWNFLIYTHQIARNGRALLSSLSDDDDFALVGLNAPEPAESLSLSSLTNQQSAFGAPDVQPIGKDNEDGSSSVLSKQNTSAKNSDSIPLQGLTADGDFVLEGVNAVDPSANQALEKYGTPLLDPSKADNNEILAQLSLSTQPRPSISETMDQVTGILSSSSLTEDGDLAMPGFNSVQENQQQPQESSYSTRPQSTQPWEQPSTMPQQQQQQPAAVVPILAQVPTTPAENNLEQVEDMTFWLQEIIPTLRDEDCILYAQGLVSLGFDPECVTAGELQIEDLLFMKPLHRQYLVKELQVRSSNDSDTVNGGAVSRGESQDDDGVIDNSTLF